MAQVTVNQLAEVVGAPADRLLSQMAASATGRRVITGPIEATAIGNLLMQMLAMGQIASLDEGREIVRTSFAAEIAEFEPQDSEHWKSALQRWRTICRSR